MEINELQPSTPKVEKDSEGKERTREQSTTEEKKEKVKNLRIEVTPEEHKHLSMNKIRYSTAHELPYLQWKEYLLNISEDANLSISTHINLHKYETKKNKD